MAPPPGLNTNATVDSITSNSAICGGNNIYLSITTLLMKGLCWSKTNPLPTPSDSFTDEFPSDPTANSFYSTMTGLDSNTLYYVRAYIRTTNAGGSYNYGSVNQFTTLSSVKPKVISIGGHGTRLNGKKITLTS